MKKISMLLILILISGSFSLSCAEEEAEVTVSYKSGFTNTQGQDNFYMCSFKGNEVTDFKWNDSNQRWMNTNSLPMIKYDFMNPVAGEDVGFRFKAPTVGMVRLKGEATFPYADVQKGNGVILSIMKGSKELWKAGPTKQTETYDLIVSVKAGDEIYFKANANGNEAFDWVYWYPSVDYLAMDYVNDDKSTYFQKTSDNMTQLEFNGETLGYTASDGIAFISTSEVLPTEKNSLVKRNITDADGRYRLYARMNIEDVRSGGNVVYVYKNGEKFWEQLIAPGEEQVVDIGFMAKKDDVIDVEVGVNDYAGYNYTSWECELVRYIKPFVCEASASVGRNTGILGEYTLGSFVGTNQGANGSAFYTLKNNMVYPMTYNQSEKKWKSSVPTDTGYISATEVYPGSEWAVGGDSVMEFALPESGIINLRGAFDVNTAGDGVLIKVYINDELLWSNRVGGERNVRWDEPYDVCYFLNYADVVAKVEQGDVMKLTFNGWRKKSKDDVGTENVKLRYISENVISDTTRWKLNKSIVVDTVDKYVHRNGERYNVDVLVNDGTTYIATEDISKVFGTEKRNTDKTVNINGKSYTALRTAAENSGRYVTWAADRIVLIHDSYSVFIGYPEISEIKTAIEIGGDLFE